MTHHSSAAFDVAILGAGFGGSLMALVLAKLGMKVALLDRGQHPRFALGESSTPIADAILRDLAAKYDLPRIAPLARYGTWKATYPELGVGLKRGFSYFHHTVGEPFRPRSDHSNELLVAASGSDELADTHWLRSDVDAFFTQEAVAAGVAYFDQTQVQIEHGALWKFAGERHGQPIALTAAFVIDASGEGGALPRALHLVNEGDRCRTASRTVYAHFDNVHSFHEIYATAGGQTADHPFRCVDAALHHVLEEGWMWHLRFTHGVVSLGFVLDMHDEPAASQASAEQQWSYHLQRYPSIAEQLAQARVVAPAGGIRKSGRLQRKWSAAAGENWALLPSSAGFIDPLHSTGIAHTLSGVERLAEILHREWGRQELATSLQRYGDTVRREIDLIDTVVSACYRGRRDFRLFTAASMLYFLLGTNYERERYGQAPKASGFLCVDHPDLPRIVEEQWQRLAKLGPKSDLTEADIGGFEDDLRETIRPWNHVGICDPTRMNMYHHTAAPKSA